MSPLGTEAKFGHIRSTSGLAELHFRCHASITPANKASGRILEKIGLKYSRDEDLKDSVKKGIGLRPFYTLDSESYLKARGQS